MPQKHILYVCGVMFYDFQLIRRTIEHLYSQKSDFKLRPSVRLHPSGRVLLKDRLWLTLAKWREKLTISKGALKEDMQDAAMVIGANSTVIIEAALKGIPTINLLDERYLCSDLLSDFKRHTFSPEALNWKILKECIENRPTIQAAQTYRNYLGLNQFDLTTKLIYETWQQQSTV